MELYSRTYGTGPQLLILHGLFGSSDNWATMAKKLAENYTVITADLRNHGRSPWSDDCSYEAMVQDVALFIEQLDSHPVYLLGHSMGGKVAMLLATSHPNLIKKLVVVDIAPKYYRPHHEREIAAQVGLDLSAVTSRDDADQKMAAWIDDFGVRQFLLKNLTRTDEGGFAWKHNLKAIVAQIETVGQALPDNAHIDVPTLFMRGANSRYIKPEDETLIREIFSDVRIDTVPNAGHWVQAENPVGFYESLSRFLLP